MWRLAAILVCLVFSACDSVQTASERADRSYDEARSAAASAGFYLPEPSFVERHSAQPPADTAPWVVTIARDEMRELDLVSACTASTGDFKAILCVEQRIGEEARLVSVETEDRLDCSRDCTVSVRFGAETVREFGVAGTRSHFTLQGRRSDDLPQRVAASDVVFVEGAFERDGGARQQMRFSTQGLVRALEWRPSVQSE